MKTYCDACGVEKVDGKHPNTTCTDKEWAAHQGRMLREIIITLNKIAAALPPLKIEESGEAKGKKASE